MSKELCIVIKNISDYYFELVLVLYILPILQITKSGNSLKCVAYSSTAELTGTLASYFNFQFQDDKGTSDSTVQKFPKR